MTRKNRFDGSDYVEEFDSDRLTGQLARVFDLMKDGQWRTLSEIQDMIKDPQASISAQLRNLRKKRFGENIIEKRTRGHRSQGLFEYKLELNKDLK
jgi:hypothetical protein